MGQKAGIVVFFVLLLIYLYVFSTVSKLPGDSGLAAMVVGIIVIVGISVFIGSRR